MIPPDPKDIDRITDLINLQDLPKDRNKEEETTKEEEKAEHSPRAVHPSSANAHPLGRRSTSITSGHELQEEQESDDTFWSAAIKTAMQDESRIPILAELSPTDIDPPKAIDQDEVQELCSIIETKDGEIPQNLCQHLAEILLTRFTV